MIERQKQYKALVTNHNGNQEVIYIIAFDKAHAMMMLNEMQNVLFVLAIKEY
jgi:hypothetical protein